MTLTTVSAPSVDPANPHASGAFAFGTRPIRVVIADDQVLLRQGLASLAGQSDAISVVGQAGSGPQVLGAIDRCRPDVVVLDLSASATAGLEVLQRMKRHWPRVGVLVLSAAAESRFATRCLRAGADGYLTHDHGREDLTAAIERIARGGKYVTEELAEELAATLQDADDRPPHEALSDREFQVMCLIAEGIPPTRIADRLGLSVKTVSTYRTRLLKKLELENTAEIMRYAIANELGA